MQARPFADQTRRRMRAVPARLTVPAAADAFGTNPTAAFAVRTGNVKAEDATEKAPPATPRPVRATADNEDPTPQRPNSGSVITPPVPPVFAGHSRPANRRPIDPVMPCYLQTNPCHGGHNAVGLAHPYLQVTRYGRGFAQDGDPEARSRTSMAVRRATHFFLPVEPRTCANGSTSSPCS
jgi:hypothetical protein